MLKYILKRLAIFIPTLFAISLIAFAISVNAPGDPVDIYYSGAKGGDGSRAENKSTIEGKKQLRHELGLDLPVFYFSLSNFAAPDTLYKVTNLQARETLDRLIDTYGNWNEISAWYLSLCELKQRVQSITPDSTAEQLLGKEKADSDLDEAAQRINSLFLSYEEVVITSKLSKLEELMANEKSAGTHGPLVAIDEPLSLCNHAFEEMKSNSSSWKTWIPTLHFYGNNQYERWLFGDGNALTGAGAVNTKGVIRGDFGRSPFSHLPVSQLISTALPWSLLFTLTSVLLAYLVSIPIGVRAAAKRGDWFDRSSSVTLFMLYSLPVFFLATLLMITFSNPNVFDLLPAHGVMPAKGYPEGASLLEKIRISLPYMIMPFVCYTYSSLAFLSRTMRVSMLEIISQDYIRTANAKGLSYFRVIYKHGLRNALLPIITTFANIFPAAVGGSVIIEVIFGIPGMGQQAFDAIGNRDYPLIVAVFTLSGFMTLVGYLVADILYAIADPRITYSK